MMEDADGYNQIWLQLQLVFAELVGRPHDVAAPAMMSTIANFRDYIGPDGKYKTTTPPVFSFNVTEQNHYPIGISFTATVQKHYPTGIHFKFNHGDLVGVGTASARRLHVPLELVAACHLCPFHYADVSGAHPNFDDGITLSLQGECFSLLQGSPHITPLWTTKQCLNAVQRSAATAASGTPQSK